jgi:hypothetical protein
MHEKASQQAVEANTSYSKTVMEVRKVIVSELSPLLWLDEPDPEKLLKEYILECYHRVLDIFIEKEAIPLPMHQP